MRQQRALWRVAIVLFALGLYFTMAEASSGPDSAGDHASFTWGQVCVLMAVAAAWGDMRAQVKDLRKDVDSIKHSQKD